MRRATDASVALTHSTSRFYRLGLNGGRLNRIGLRPLGLRHRYGFSGQFLDLFSYTYSLWGNAANVRLELSSWLKAWQLMLLHSLVTVKLTPDLR